MKKIKPGSIFYFVDESGNPTFYDRKGNLIVGQEGCSSMLKLGLVEIKDPIPVRQAILQLKTELTNEPYLLCQARSSQPPDSDQSRNR